MTIQHVNPERRLDQFIKFLFFGIAVLVFSLVYLHNLASGLRARAGEQAQIIQHLEVANAVVKSELYSLLASERLNEIAKSSGMVKDSLPQFLSVEDMFANSKIGLDKAQTALRE